MKLTAKKRNHLIFLGLGTVVVIAVLFTLLIKREKRQLEEIKKRTAEVREKVKVAEHRLELADRFKDELQRAQTKLRTIEQTMPQGDEYRWFINTMMNFPPAQRIEINNYDPARILELEAAPKLGYRAAIFGVRGTARYHDFGFFLAQLENAFPYSRVQNIELEPVGVAEANAEDEEKLSFKMDVVIPIKSSPANP